MEQQLFAIAQEALNNALWHADASAVVVRIRAEDDAVVLSVEDDGIGFDPTAESAGLGLVTIRERAKAIGGQQKITASPQQGTTIKIWVALDADAL